MGGRVGFADSEIGNFVLGCSLDVECVFFFLGECVSGSGGSY